jgi:hypothetical protein
MAGTPKGGAAAAETNKKKYGSDFYAKIGAMGGKKGRTGGFFANRELARQAALRAVVFHVAQRRKLLKKTSNWQLKPIDVLIK